MKTIINLNKFADTAVKEHGSYNGSVKIWLGMKNLLVTESTSRYSQLLTKDLSNALSEFVTKYPYSSRPEQDFSQFLKAYQSGKLSLHFENKEFKAFSQQYALDAFLSREVTNGNLAYAFAMPIYDEAIAAKILITEDLPKRPASLAFKINSPNLAKEVYELMDNVGILEPIIQMRLLDVQKN
ncbi:MAG: hypothetical protein NTV88_03160 [Candidatus Micrarchaeota archaeon]|nr:hypothetical protein [Candidatus Micrarchaeota archaeon]